MLHDCQMLLLNLCGHVNTTCSASGKANMNVADLAAAVTVSWL